MRGDRRNVLLSGDVPPFGWPSPRRNSEYIRFSGTLLFLISKSEEQADDHQKQNPVTSSARGGSDLKHKTDSKGLASRDTCLMPDLSLNSLEQSAIRCGRWTRGFSIAASMNEDELRYLQKMRSLMGDGMCGTINDLLIRIKARLPQAKHQANEKQRAASHDGKFCQNSFESVRRPLRLRHECV